MSKARRQKAVATVVIETDRPVPKRLVKEWLERVMAVTPFLDPWQFEDMGIVEKARVRSVDID